MTQKQFNAIKHLAREFIAYHNPDDIEHICKIGSAIIEVFCIEKKYKLDLEKHNIRKAEPYYTISGLYFIGYEANYQG